MIGKSTTALIAAAIAAMVGTASPTFAQAWDPGSGTGNVQSLQYDSLGGKHRYTYGYYGPAMPSIAPQSERLGTAPRSEKLAVRQNGRHAYAMVPNTRTLYDYSPDFSGAPAASGYDPALTGGGSIGYNQTNMIH